jgi:hypothetical protein
MGIAPAPWPYVIRKEMLLFPAVPRGEGSRLTLPGEAAILDKSGIGEKK